MRRLLLASLTATALSGATHAVAAPTELRGSAFVLRFADDGSVESLQRPTAPELNYLIERKEHPEFAVRDARWFGNLVLRVRTEQGGWQMVSTALLPRPRVVKEGDCVTVGYSAPAPRLTIDERFCLAGDALAWTISVSNAANKPLTIGDLGVPLLFNTYYERDPHITYGKRFVRQSNIAGDNSFLVWTLASGIGPRLLMTPKQGSGFEYFDHVDAESRAPADKAFTAKSGWEGLYTAYVHASVQATTVENRGTWRRPLTNRIVAPGGVARYAFDFHWAADDAAVRRTLVDAGKVDVKFSPGLVIPMGTDAAASLEARGSITALEPEFPDATLITRGKAPNGRDVFTLRFTKPGENYVTMRWGTGQSSRIEYFVTQSPEAMVKRRAAFLVANQQVKDPSKWYDGVFGQWDMAERTLRTPDDLGGLARFMPSGSDDPSLGKAPYVASKNLIYPDAGEIAAIEYYVKHFVWGKLQRTDRETPFPWGIYGTPDWRELRNAPGGWETGGVGKDHMWRTFDYPHLIQLYFQMYRVARRYPSLVRELSADTYLDRAYHTAVAFFEVPYQIKMGDMWAIQGWSDWAFKQGNFHELYIPMLIDALVREGRAADAAKLRGYWEQKVKYFAYDHPYPFGSEMYFDTTAFQSTYAIGLYGATHDIPPDRDGFYDKNLKRSYSHPVVRRSDFDRFIDRATAANLAARGRFPQAYYLYGSDIRQEGDSAYLLSYMTAMGGGPLLDRALRQKSTDFDLLRLGYASVAGSWALVNGGATGGDAAFRPAAANDGAAGWAFNPVKFGAVWAGPTLSQGRGPWRYDGEIDNGLSDSLLSMASVVTEDDDFGLQCLGCTVRRGDGELAITARDAVRQRLFVRTATRRVDLALDQDRFSNHQEILLGAAAVRFGLERERAATLPTRLMMSGMPAGRYRVTAAGQTLEEGRTDAEGMMVISLPADLPNGAEVHVQRSGKDNGEH